MGDNQSLSFDKEQAALSLKNYILEKLSNKFQCKVKKFLCFIFPVSDILSTSRKHGKSVETEGRNVK